MNPDTFIPILPTVTLLRPRPEPEIRELGQERILEGRFNERLTINPVSIVLRAGDPTQGIYTCEVCIARGFPEIEDCHNSSTEVFGIGAPPDLIEDPDDAGIFKFGGIMSHPSTQYIIIPQFQSHLLSQYL